jgi:hypothetical protein
LKEEIMANNGRSPSFVAHAVVLILGVVVGWFLRTVVRPGDGHGTPTPCPTGVVVIATPTPTCVPLSTTPGIQRVLVGPGACDVKPECLTIQAGRDSVQWNTLNVPQGKNLAIDFSEQLFSGMSQSNGGKSWRVQCSGQQCLSGSVNPQITPPPGYQKEYKYSQTIFDSGTNQACDGKIIIKW